MAMIPRDDSMFKPNPVSHLFKNDFSHTKLRPDHERRPLWVCPNRHIYLETYSPIYKQAYDFLIAISDPVSRPSYLHEYVVTEYSLYAAASLGLSTDDILRGLNKMSKTEIDPDVIRFIRKHTEKCGKVKLLLKNRRYYVESLEPAVLNLLLRDPFIGGTRVDNKTTDAPQAPQDLSTSVFASRVVIASDAVQLERDPKTGFLIERLTAADTEIYLPGTGVRGKDGVRQLKKIDQRRAMGLVADEAGATKGEEGDESDGERSDDSSDGEDGDYQPPRADSAAAADAPAADESAYHPELHPGAGRETLVYSFEVDATKVESVRRRSNELGYPMLEEYDFRHDQSAANQVLPVDLKPQAQVRHYQEKALSKMFGNGRARSGIIVLPCGAGKTLVGITAMSTVRRATLIYCTTGVAVEQWRRQVKLWTNLPDEYIFTFTRTSKSELRPDVKVVITTYSMVAYEQKRSRSAQKVMEAIATQEWGLVLLDEVHVAPADKFSKCVKVTHSRCKLGLTATLVREDDKVEELYFMLGPKLYEASWLDLSKQGFIASVQCIEVWCPMTPDFYREYLRADHHRQMLLYVCNPHKYMALEMLVRIHEARGDQIMVFSDNVFALSLFAKKLNRFFLYGGTSDQERLEVLRQFSDPKEECRTIFISKIGDNSIDLPDTNVIIQISSHFSSRRQEAQRLGRILRPKSHKSGKIDAHFYTLVSQDTKEMQYATKRQRFLVDQGYAYKVMRQVELENAVRGTLHDKPLGFSSLQEQLELLAEVVRPSADIEENIDVDDVFAEKKLSGKGAEEEDEAGYGGDYGSDSDSDYREDTASATGGRGRTYGEVKRRKR